MKNVVIVGAGNMAREHLIALSQISNVNIAGIYSRTQSKAFTLAERFSIPKVAEDLTDLFDSINVDGAVIAVNETETLKLCEHLSKYNCYYLIEKPLGLNLGETQHIASIFGAQASRIFVGLNRRHYDGVMKAQHKLAEASDDIRIIKIVDQEAPSLASTLGRDVRVIRDWHFANSIHLIDLFTLFARGKVKRVNNILPWCGPKTKFTHSVIEFDSGDIGIYHSIWDAPGPWALTVETEKIRVHMEPLEAATIQTFPNREKETLSLVDTNKHPKAGFLAQMKSFLSAMTGNDHRLCSLVEYSRSVQLVDALYSEKQTFCD